MVILLYSRKLNTHIRKIHLYKVVILYRNICNNNIIKDDKLDKIIQINVLYTCIGKCIRNVEKSYT